MRYAILRWTAAGALAIGLAAATRAGNTTDTIYATQSAVVCAPATDAGCNALGYIQVRDVSGSIAWYRWSSSDCTGATASQCFRPSVGTYTGAFHSGPLLLQSTGVTAGVYSCADITVDVSGRLTLASAGGCGATAAGMYPFNTYADLLADTTHSGWAAVIGETNNPLLNGTFYRATTGAAWTKAQQPSNVALRAIIPLVGGGATTADNDATNYANIQAVLNLPNSAAIWVDVTVIPYAVDTLTEQSGSLIVYSNTNLNFTTATITKKNGASSNACLIRNANIVTDASPTVVQTNITLQGGIWDGNASGNSGVRTTCGGVTGVYGELSFVGVDNFKMQNLTVSNSNGAFIQYAGGGFVMENLRSTSGDGPGIDFIHLNGNTSKGHIRNIWGASRDDFVAVNAWDWSISSPIVGPIRDLVIEGLHRPAIGYSEQVTSSIVRFLPGTRGGVTANIENVTVRDVDGDITNTPFLFDYNTDSTYGPSGVGYTKNVVIEGVRNLRVRNTSPMVALLGKVYNLTLRDIFANDNSNGPVISQSTKTSDGAGNTLTGWVDRIILDNYEETAPITSVHRFDLKGWVGEFRVINSSFVGVNNGSNFTGQDFDTVYVNGGGQLDNLFVSSTRQQFGGSLLGKNSDAATAPTLAFLNGYTGDHIKHVFFLYQAAEVHTAASLITNIQNDLGRIDGTSFALFGSSFTTTYVSGAVPFYNGGGAIRVNSTSLAVDGNKTVINAFQAGDTIVNNNAALSAGLGLWVANDTTTWTNVATRATY